MRLNPDVPAGAGRHHQQGAGKRPRPALPARLGDPSRLEAAAARQRLRSPQRRSDAGIERRPSIVCILIAVCSASLPSPGEREQFGSSVFLGSVTVSPIGGQQFERESGSAGAQVWIGGDRCGRFGLACRWRIWRVLAAQSQRADSVSEFHHHAGDEHGKAQEAAISPDGKYVLNVQNDNGMQSLWLRNVPTGSDTQIVPPAAAVYSILAFSPDGNYVYFRKAGIGTQSEWISTALRCWGARRR